MDDPAFEGGVDELVEPFFAFVEGLGMARDAGEHVALPPDDENDGEEPEPDGLGVGAEIGEADGVGFDGADPGVVEFVERAVVADSGQGVVEAGEGRGVALVHGEAKVVDDFVDELAAQTVVVGDVFAVQAPDEKRAVDFPAVGGVERGLGAVEGFDGPAPPAVGAGVAEGDAAAERADGFAGEVGGGQNGRAVTALVNDAVHVGVADGKIHVAQALVGHGDVGEHVEPAGPEVPHEGAPRRSDDFEVGQARAAHRRQQFGGEAGRPAGGVDEGDGVVGPFHADAQAWRRRGEGGKTQGEEETEERQAHGKIGVTRLGRGDGRTLRVAIMPHDLTRTVERIAAVRQGGGRKCRGWAGERRPRAPGGDQGTVGRGRTGTWTSNRFRNGGT